MSRFDNCPQFVPSEKYLFDVVDDEMILLNLADGNYYGLNSTARTVFEGIQQKRTLSQIATDLSSNFDDVTLDQANTDVEETVNEFLAIGLIEEQT